MLFALVISIMMTGCWLISSLPLVIQLLLVQGKSARFIVVFSKLAGRLM